MVGCAADSTIDGVDDDALRKLLALGIGILLTLFCLMELFLLSKPLLASAVNALSILLVILLLLEPFPLDIVLFDILFGAYI